MMRLFSGQRLRLGDDGSQLIEVAVGAFVLAVAVLGVVGSMGTGLGLVGDSRQRSAAVAVAQERLERARNVPYCGNGDPTSDDLTCDGGLALYEQPVHSTVVDSPDADVECPPSNLPEQCTPTNAMYRVTTGGTTVTEPLVVALPDDNPDTPDGLLKHIDDPINLGNTEFNIYQYVTWHDDPNIAGAEDYKRVVVIVTWKFPVHTGPSNRVVQSSFVGNDKVIVPPATPAPSATPSAAPSASPSSGSGNCGMIEVLSAAQGYTNSTTLQVRLSRTSSCSSSAPNEIQMKNTGAAYVTVWTGTPTALQANPVTLTWTIPAGDGVKTIFAKFLEAGSGPSEKTATVILDQTKPTAPALAKVSCAVQGSSRTVSFQWTAATDTNLVGYRVYKSVNNGPFTVMPTQAVSPFTDTDSKGYESLRYLVRAYDNAGNENALGPPIATGDSNVLSYSKVSGNSCS